MGKKNENGLKLVKGTKCKLRIPGAGGGYVGVTVAIDWDPKAKDDEGFIKGVLVEYGDGGTEWVPSDELYAI